MSDDFGGIEPMIVGTSARNSIDAALARVNARAAAKAARPAGECPRSLAHVVRELRARLRVVEREIKARKTLESERAQLLRLIDAAKAERQGGNVRRLRTAG